MTMEHAGKIVLKNFFSPISKPVTERFNDRFMVTGDAIHAMVSRNDVKYTVEELQNAAPSMIGKPILLDHDESVLNIVGVCKDAWYDSTSECIQYKAQIMEPKIQEMIKDGRIQNVSIGASVDDLVETIEGDQTYRTAKGLSIDELSFVVVPGDSGASTRMLNGEGFALSIAEAFDRGVSALKTKEEMPPGMPPAPAGGQPAPAVPAAPVAPVANGEQAEDNIIVQLQAALQKLTLELEQLKAQQAGENKMAGEQPASAPAAPAAESALVKLTESISKLTEKVEALEAKDKSPKETVPKARATKESAEGTVEKDNFVREKTRFGTTFYRGE